MKAVSISLAVVMTAWYYMQANSCLGGLGCDHSQTGAAQLFVKESMKTAFHTFNASVGHYPTTEEGLAALLKAPKGTEARWRGPYIEGGKVPIDPWGREYQYRFPALKSTVGYDFWSLGPDGVPSADDIGNWSN